jgi:acyl-CoA reductase-like NAD-dependent aldehyde dehydrogenase
VSEKCSDIKSASKVLAKNIFYNQGQICSAPSRLIIHQGIKERFLELLVKDADEYIPDNPLNINCEVGAVISSEQKKIVQSYIRNGIKSGAKVITNTDEILPVHGGEYIRPVIFDNVDPNSKIAQEEIFGPVLIVITVQDIKEAIKIANNTNYGLAASIWTNDYDEACQVSKQLESGIVHINSYGEDDNTVPFGGFKESGIGKDKSIFAFNEYSNFKTTWMKFNSL